MTMSALTKHCSVMKRKRKIKFQRRYITFVEIMIVITILIISLGLIGVNIRDLTREQRFKSEVSLVVDQLRLAQDLMLMLNTDSIVKFSRKGKGVVTSIDVESILSKGWQREINRERPPLNAITDVEFFEDAASLSKNSELPLELNFLSGGSVMSQGVLRLANHDWKQETFICLPGYPRSIVNVADPKMDPGCNSKVEVDFSEKLTFYTRREIEERVQKNALQGNR
jgi:type II secretory pathway pseudopilin PulG